MSLSPVIDQAAPPPAPSPTVAQLLLRYLQLEGVTKIFGIPGGACIFIMNELKKQQDTFQFLICRHETGAAYIAHGYSIATDGLGVLLTTSGPGSTNALTGAINANMSGVPLLLITGEVSQKFFGQAYLQEGIEAQLDVGEVYKNAVQYSTMISSPDNFVTLFQQALREARSLPSRAVHVSLPNNVANVPPTVAEPMPDSPETYRAVPSSTDPVKVRQAFDDLTRANWPLIFLGNGCRTALQDAARRERFTAFVDRFAIPVMTTPDAKGIFRETHPLSLRNYGLCGCNWTALYMGQQSNDNFAAYAAQIGSNAKEYDALLVLGSNLGELATSLMENTLYAPVLVPTDSFTQVDLDQRAILRSFPVNQSMAGRKYPKTRGIVAEVGATIDKLCEFADLGNPAASTTARRSFIDSIKRDFAPCDRPDWYSSSASPVNPAAAMRVLNEELGDGHIISDCGNCVGWAFNYLIVDPPLQFHSVMAMGPMGFAIGAVIGAKLGAPEKTCVAVCGDGAFMMHGAEISTAAQYGIGAIWVVLYDNDLAMVSQGMQGLFSSDSWLRYYKLGKPDLVKFAAGLGAYAVDVDSPEDFRAALRSAIDRSQSGQPQAIIVNIDTNPSPPYDWPKV